jgi:hypothetical protein
MRWYGYRIRTIDDDVEEGTAIVLEDDDLVDYSKEENNEENKEESRPKGSPPL